MELPNILQVLIDAQNKWDSDTYAACFSATAVVADEGETHTGRTAIKQWIEKASRQYHAVMEPLDYTDRGTTGMLTAKVSGTFDGSPIVLKYHLEISDALIQSLKITG